MKIIIFIMLLSVSQTQQQTNQVDCPVIGIDLGTTYSCVGIYKNGNVEIIQNYQGNRITPSIVAFTDEEILMGEAAKNQASINPFRTIYDIKRLIGKKYTDQIVKYEKKIMPYEIVDKEAKLYIQINNIKGHQSRIFSPEKISMILSKMKEISQTYLGSKVDNAVITVPAHFDEAQRAAIKNAGQIAGLNVVILNESIAAAIAFGLNKKDGEMHIMVFNLGGGTFDVSILSIDNGTFEVIASSGNNHLGGEDFDQRITDYFVKIIKLKYNRDVSGDKRVVQKLKWEAVKFKRMLSTIFEVKIEIEINELEFNEVLTRAKFEELNQDLFNKIIEPMKIALQDSKLKINEIREIILVGGSSRIPKIRELVKQFFNGRIPNTSINPDEAVCYGAAIQGGIICQEESKATEELIVLDVTSQSFGIEASKGGMSKIIPKGTFIPAQKTQTYATINKNQKVARISVYSGEKGIAKENIKLGSLDFVLGNKDRTETSDYTDIIEIKKNLINQNQRSLDLLEVTLQINLNGTLHVQVVEKKTVNHATMFLASNLEVFSKEKINEIQIQAEQLAQQYNEDNEVIETKQSLQSYIDLVKKFIETSLGKQLSVYEKQNAFYELQDSQNWLTANQNVQKEDYQQELRYLQRILNPLINRAYQKQDQYLEKDDYNLDL